MIELPVIDSCDDCGACCRQTPIPPFQPGEEHQRNVPAQLLQVIQQRIVAGLEFELIPCLWFNVQTLRCSHYELRPTACRRFEVNSSQCHAARNAERYP